MVDLCMWVAIFVCGGSALFFGQLLWQGRHGLLLALGVVWWLSLAALLGCLVVG